MKNVCSHCGTDIYYEGTVDVDTLLCDDCQDHKDALEHWHQEFLNDLADECNP